MFHRLKEQTKGLHLKTKRFLPSQLDQIIVCDPIVLKSICYRTKAYQLINESNTTGGLIKIWTGSKQIENLQLKGQAGREW